jgi:hypothetical protein
MEILITLSCSIRWPSSKPLTKHCATLIDQRYLLWFVVILRTDVGFIYYKSETLLLLCSAPVHVYQAHYYFYYVS